MVCEQSDVEALAVKTEKTPYAIKTFDNLFKGSESIHMMLRCSHDAQMIECNLGGSFDV